MWPSRRPRGPWRRSSAFACSLNSRRNDSPAFAPPASSPRSTTVRTWTTRSSSKPAGWQRRRTPSPVGSSTLWSCQRFPGPATRRPSMNSSMERASPSRQTCPAPAKHSSLKAAASTSQQGRWTSAASSKVGLWISAWRCFPGLPRCVHQCRWRPVLLWQRRGWRWHRLARRHRPEARATPTVGRHHHRRTRNIDHAKAALADRLERTGPPPHRPAHRHASYLAIRPGVVLGARNLACRGVGEGGTHRRRTRRP